MAKLSLSVLVVVTLCTSLVCASKTEGTVRIGKAPAAGSPVEIKGSIKIGKAPAAGSPVVIQPLIEKAPAAGSPV